MAKHRKKSPKNKQERASTNEAVLYINIHLEVPSYIDVPRELRTQLMVIDQGGQIVSTAITRVNGHAVASIFAEGNQKYKIEIVSLDQFAPFQYKVWAAPAKRKPRAVGNSFGIGGVHVYDERVFVAADSNLEIYDVSSDTMSPTGSLNLGTASDVVVEDDIAYVASGNDGLSVVDVSNSGSPSLLGSATAIGFAKNLVKYNNEIYADAGQYGVLVFDVSDPSAPVWSDTLIVADTVDDVTLGRNILVVTTLSGTVEIYGLKGKSRHQHLAQITAAGWVRDTKVRGSHLYLLEPYGVVEEFDISALSNIRKVGEYTEDELAVSSSIDGNVMMTLDNADWIADTVELIRIEDVTDEEAL